MELGDDLAGSLSFESFEPSAWFLPLFRLGGQISQGKNVEPLI